MQPLNRDIEKFITKAVCISYIFCVIFRVFSSFSNGKISYIYVCPCFIVLVCYASLHMQKKTKKNKSIAVTNNAGEEEEKKNTLAKNKWEKIMIIIATAKIVCIYACSVHLLEFSKQR